jgi:hypothetical protein
VVAWQAAARLTRVAAGPLKFKQKSGAWIASTPHMPDREFYRWQVRSFTVRLALDVVERISHHLDAHRNSHINPAEEHGGLLMGRVIDLNNVEITGFEFIRSRHRRGTPYDLGASERTSFARYVQTFEKRRGPKPIGYFRTHLRPGLFLDQSDFELMTEAFSSRTGISLAIRTEDSSNPSAGIFFWEDGDLERSKSERIFPFDAEKLRIQGPIEREARQPARAIARRAIGWPVTAPRVRSWASVLKARASSPALGIMCGLAGGILAFATLSALHQNSARPLVRTASHSNSTPVPPPVRTRSPQEPEFLEAPPPAYHDDAEPEEETDAPGTSTASRRSAFPSPVAHVTVTPPANAPAVNLADSPAVSTTPPPALPAPEPEPLHSSPPEARPLRVEVEVEPKGAPIFKKIAGRVPAIAGHVPLLGRLHVLHHDERDGVVAARPAAGLEPRIPAGMNQEFSGEVEVDIQASIDSRGVVQNTEITKGTRTQLDTLAENTVRSVQWKPARSGDHAVPMDMVVHYRFNADR